MVGLSIFLFFAGREMFATVLFFTLILLTRPLNFRFTNFINIDFPGTFYLIPIILFTILILTIPYIKRNISWWQRDSIDGKTWQMIIALSIVSGLALFIWAKFTTHDLSKFIINLPDVVLPWIIINGVGFALLNSIAEEYLSRGMLCNGLEKIIVNKKIIILIQAILFSIFHYNGFPGGMTGAIMVLLWSIVLGIVRYRTKGLFGVLIGHFFADLTIYFTLYSLK
jgi:membrane protease YdiL (CAAX protease family)